MFQIADRNDYWVAVWLASCAAVIFGMILLGGVTRLTDSGLSMVEWQPIMGVIPPLSEHDWQIAFDKYKLFPEYQKINRGMDMSAFKVIFMYEYLHRVLGRLIGILFFVPLVIFAAKKMIRPGLMPKLLGLLVLGGCQGLLGWYMVQSGLVDRPDVSQYRLTAHLGLAVLIYALIVWLVLDLTAAHRSPRRNAALWPIGLVGLVYVMILSGGFVAGTDAGFVYPTWPLMGEHFLPPELYSQGLISAFEHVPTVQFNHRMFAYVLTLLIVIAGVRSWLTLTDRRQRWSGLVLIAALCLQVFLGISTLLTHVAIPVAAAHQGGAVVLLTAALFFAFALRTRAHS